MDGGDLEDALIGLGRFGDTHMESLLDLAAKNWLSSKDLRRALVILPPELADDQRAQLQKLKARRGEIERITRPTLSKYRKEALEAIDAFIGQIERAAPNKT